MNWLILLVLLVLLFSGCHLGMVDMSPESQTDMLFSSYLVELELYYIEADINSLGDIGYFMQQNVVYKSDGDKDTWTTPEDTYKRGYGDCEDLTFLFMNMVYTHLGLKFDMVLVDTDERQVIEGGHINHAEPTLNGQSYSVWTGYPIDPITIRYLYSFDSIFNRSYLKRR